MNKRVFFKGAMLLAVVALVSHSVSRGFLEDYMHRTGDGIEQAQKQHIAYLPDPQVLRSARTYDVLTAIGVGLTALSFVFMITALIRREPGWYLILSLLLLFDLGAAILL